jgi:hypothetical protein
MMMKMTKKGKEIREDVLNTLEDSIPTNIYKNMMIISTNGSLYFVLYRKKKKKYEDFLKVVKVKVYDEETRKKIADIFFNIEKKKKISKRENLKYKDYVEKINLIVYYL